MHGWGVGTMAGVGVLAAWFVACAGEDIPPVDEELRGNIEDVYGDEQGGGGQQGNAGSASPPGGASGAAGAGSDPPGGGAAGSGEPVGGGGGGGNANLCNAYEDVLIPSCGLAGCHNEASTQNGNFAVDGGEAGIVEFIDRPSQYSTCDGSFIDSADTDNSLILRKTEDPIPDGCGNLQMPAAGALLEPDQVDCLQEWLTQFAN